MDKLSNVSFLCVSIVDLQSTNGKFSEANNFLEDSNYNTSILKQITALGAATVNRRLKHQGRKIFGGKLLKKNLNFLKL